MGCPIEPDFFRDGQRLPLQARIRRFAPSICILRQVVGNRVPRRSIVYERVKLRSDSRIIVERSHPYRNLRTIGPIASKKTRAAVSAKCFDRAFAPSIHPNQFAALQQLEPLLPHSRLSANRRARVFAATFAMAVAGPNKWRLNLKSNRAAKTTATEFRVHRLRRLDVTRTSVGEATVSQGT
jgi:hypothetical protein